MYCRHCGNQLFDGKPFCGYCGNQVGDYAFIGDHTGIINNYSNDLTMAQYKLNGKLNTSQSRSLYFSIFSDSDEVLFYIEDELVRVYDAFHDVTRCVPNEEVRIYMTYGRNHRKKASLSIPADGNNYFIIGGKPGDVVTKFCALPINVFEDYIESIHSDILSSRLRRWDRIRSNVRHSIMLFYDHFEFSYLDDSSVPADGEWHLVGNSVVKVKYSKLTMKKRKAIRIKGKLWDTYGFIYCIRKIIYSRLTLQDGFNIGYDGVFINGDSRVKI